MNRNNRDVSGLKGMCLLLAFSVGALTVLPRQQTAQAGAPSPVLPELVNRKILASIDRGLKYLVDTQRRDGSWLNQGGYGMYPAVMTGLSGLALMAGGSTPETGPYAKSVAKAMNYLLRVAETHTDGLVAGPGAEYRSMYGHGFSMLFLAQCYGMELNTSTEAKLRKILNGGVQLIVKSQSKKTSRFGKPCGGWYYTPGSSSDEGSVTVTQLQALRACRNVGIKVPKDCIDKAVEYLRHCQMSDGGICYSASSRGSSRPPISAAAIACF
ncbi:MAG: terpene cyclase/mutase family protein, partial [Planctomycetes bacterium]|nr:terpene cyclase/mutase family protein [Planctomycetota bacterium]